MQGRRNNFTLLNCYDLLTPLNNLKSHPQDSFGYLIKKLAITRQ